MLKYLRLGAVSLYESASIVPGNVVSVDGLTGITDVRGTIIPRPEAHGAVEPARQFLAERNIIIEGEFWATTVDAAWAYWDTLNGLLADGLDTPQTLTWARLGGSIDFSTSVRVSGGVLPQLADGMPVVQFQLHLRAADPASYNIISNLVSVGAPTASGGMPIPLVFPIPFGAGSSGGLVVCPNAGNFKTWPTLTIAGPINGPRVGNVTTGEYLTFETLNVAAGDTLTVVTSPQGPRSAIVAGSSVMGTLRQSDVAWPSIGRNSSPQFGFTGLGGGYTVSTTLSVSWRDAYIS